MVKDRFGLPQDGAGRALAALLGSTFLLLPFLYSRQGLDQDLGPKTLGLAALVAALAVRRCLRQSRSVLFLPHPVILIAFAYAGWSLAVTATAVNVLEAAYETAKTLLATALLFEAADAMSLAGGARARAMVGRAAVAFILAASILGWGESAVELGRGYSLEALYRITGTFGHKNLFSSLVGFCLPIALFGLARFRGAWRAAAGLAFFLGGGLVLLLQTRSVWLGGAAALAVCGITWAACERPRWTLPARKNPLRGRGIIAGAAILMLAAAITAAMVPAVGMRPRILAAVDPHKNDWRLLLWRKSWDLALNAPLLGVGPGNWKIVIPKYGLDDVRRAGGEREGEETGLVRPHNDYLWVLCETGFPGLFLYGGFFAAALIVCWRRLRARPGTEEADYALSLLGTLTIYAVDAAFSFPRERIGHGAVLMVLIATLLVSRPHPGTRLHSALGGALKWLLLLVSCALVAGAWVRWRAEREVRRALDARSVARWDQVASRLRPWVGLAYPLDGYGNPTMFYAGTAYTLLGGIDRATDAFEKAAKAHPYHAHTLNDLGTCMALKRESNQAVRYFERAVAVRPGFSEAWLNGAIVFYGMQERDEARLWLAHVPESFQDPRRSRLQQLLGKAP